MSCVKQVNCAINSLPILENGDIVSSHNVMTVFIDSIHYQINVAIYCSLMTFFTKKPVQIDECSLSEAFVHCHTLNKLASSSALHLFTFIT